jgi:phosphoribosyl 1,2-cyclic phosphodiesterase
MANQTELIILGCGSSTGVPLLTGVFDQCCPDNPRNHRLRSSLAWRSQGQTWLVDAGPDVRQQCVANAIHEIQGVMLTHAHFDHIGGLDDLKPFSYPQNKHLDSGLIPKPLWADGETLNMLEQRCGYLLTHRLCTEEKDALGAVSSGVMHTHFPKSQTPYPHKDARDTVENQAHIYKAQRDAYDGSSLPVKAFQTGYFVPRTLHKASLSFLHPHLIDGPLELAGQRIVPVYQRHGKGVSLGFRWPSWAYSTDFSDLDAQAQQALQGLDLWIVDCIGYRKRHAHSHLESTLAWIRALKPRHAILTHMSAELDYETLRRQLPPGVVPAYDGMRIVLDAAGQVVSISP